MLVQHALEMAEIKPETEKDKVYEEMLLLMKMLDLPLKVQSFECALTALKIKEKELENKGFTEVHPSRFGINKLIEKAEAL